MQVMDRVSDTVRVRVRAGVTIYCRGITGRLTMQIYPDLPEVPIF